MNICSIRLGSSLDRGSRPEPLRSAGWGRSSTLLGRQLQAVADPKLGQDVGRPSWVGFELVAQPADEDPEILHLFGLRRAPDLAQQVAMGQDLAGMHNQVTQQVKF